MGIEGADGEQLGFQVGQRSRQSGAELAIGLRDLGRGSDAHVLPETSAGSVADQGGLVGVRVIRNA